MAPGSHDALIGLARGVSDAVEDAAGNPDHAQNRCGNGVAQTSDQQGGQEGAVALESVLVHTLVAVEEVLLLVDLGLGGIGVGRGQRNVSDLAVGADTMAEDGEEDGGSDGDGEGLEKVQERNVE